MKSKKIKAKNSEPKSKRCRDFDPALGNLGKMSFERLRDCHRYFYDKAVSLSDKIDLGLKAIQVTLANGLRLEVKKNSLERQELIRRALVAYTTQQEDWLIQLAYANAMAELIWKELHNREICPQPDRAYLLTD